jgi:hypothetical protein
MDEVLIAKDCGHVTLNLLGSGSIQNNFLLNLLPRKCLVAFANRWDCNGGGGVFFGIPREGEILDTMSKRQRRDYAPCSVHAEGIDWVALGEAEGVAVDEDGRLLLPSVQVETVLEETEGDIEEQDKSGEELFPLSMDFDGLS